MALEAMYVVRWWIAVSVALSPLGEATRRILSRVNEPRRPADENADTSAEAGIAHGSPYGRRWNLFANVPAAVSHATSAGLSWSLGAHFGESER